MQTLKMKILVASCASALIFAIPTIANHTWGNANGTYHWDGPSLPLQLSVIDSVDSSWQGELDETISQWNVSTALNLTITSSDDSSSARSACNIANGQIRACNYTYGTNGWSGLASLNIDSNNHILWGTAKVNDSYSMSQADRNKVMCQEVGHLFGMGHTSEDGSSQQTCMDYANDPTNSQWPNAHDYELLEEIYAHIGGGGGGGNGTLTNGVTETGLSASTGNDIMYTMEVPSGATNISFDMNGGSGDADLYVRFGAEPTDSTYDCRPYVNGNNETCAGSQTGGTYFVRVKAYNTFSGVNLTGNFTEDGGGGGCQSGNGVLCNNETESNISGARLSQTFYTIDIPTGASNLSISTSGGSGDADLYVNFGSQPSTSNYDCRPYRWGNNETCTFNSPSTGRYHVMLNGYAAYSGVDLVASYDGGTANNSLANKQPLTLNKTSSHRPGHYTLGKKVKSNDKHEMWITRHPDNTMTVTHVFKARQKD